MTSKRIFAGFCAVVCVFFYTATQGWADGGASLGRLHWGKYEVDSLKLTVNQQPPNDLVKQLRNILLHSNKELASNPSLAVVESIDREKVLSTDPRFKKSERAIRDLEILFHWSFCSRMAPEPLASACGQAARSHIMKWATVFRPSGNPINDGEVFLLFFSIDLMLDSFERQYQALLKEWLFRFISSGDAWYDAKPSHDERRINNHNTWRLAIRSVVGRILEDQRMAQETKRQLKRHLMDNLRAPLDWENLSTCPQLKQEPRYGGFDFRQRDALIYHLYNLKAWSWIFLFTPNLVDGEDRRIFLRAVEFVRPFYSGESTHIEFACTSVPFDIERKNAGIVDYQNVPWQPAKARKLLRAVLPDFPEIESWAGSAETRDGGEYAAYLKLMAALRR